MASRKCNASGGMGGRPARSGGAGWAHAGACSRRATACSGASCGGIGGVAPDVAATRRNRCGGSGAACYAGDGLALPCPVSRPVQQTAALEMPGSALMGARLDYVDNRLGLLFGPPSKDIHSGGAA